MTLSHKLEQLLSATPQCRSVFIGDRGSQIVLRRAFSTEIGQEITDQHCQTGSLLLGAELSAAACKLLQLNDMSITSATVLHAVGTEVYVAGRGQDIYGFDLEPNAIGNTVQDPISQLLNDADDVG